MFHKYEGNFADHMVKITVEIRIPSWDIAHVCDKMGLIHAIKLLRLHHPCLSMTQAKEIVYDCHDMHKLALGNKE